MPTPFDVQGARAAGYSDYEIADHLAQRQQFDIAGARKAGYSDSEIIGHLSTPKKEPSAADQIPKDLSPEIQAFVDRQPKQAAATADPSLVDRIIGGGETALALTTGLVTSPLAIGQGLVSGAMGKLTGGKYGDPDGVEAAIGKEMANNTYAPRTATGQDYTERVGRVMEAVDPNLPFVPEVSMLGHAMADSAKVARGVGGAATAAAVERIRAAAPAIAERVQRTLSRNPEPVPSAGTQGSVGAAGVDIADQRRQLAANLPVPIELTKGQAERSFEQQRFEREMAKDPTMGEPLRDRYAEQNERVLKNFDAWVDQTGAEKVGLRAVGEAVLEPMVKKAERDKNEIRVAYAKADKSPEALAEVNPGEIVRIGEGESAIESSVIGYLNSKPSGLKTTALTDHAKQYAVKLGVAERAEDGTLIPKPATVKQMEELRKEISQATGFEPVEVRDATILKGLIDTTTEPAAGPLYRQARRLRENYAKQYEDRSVVASLLNNKKGMADRKVALEDVFSHIVLKGSRDDLGWTRRVLQTGGEQGKQAWRELQGATVNWLKDQATQNVATDTRGNVIVSADKLNKALRTLDEDGKLDFIFGKQGAQQMRDINDLVKLVYTSPPGAVNTSNTASVLLAALSEAGAVGAMTGIPVPVLSSLRLLAKHAKNRALQKRIEQALSGRSNPTPPTPPARPAGATLH